MNSLACGVYRIAIASYTIILKIIAPFHSKAKKMVVGRKNIFESLQKYFPTTQKVLLFHCASLGEYLQATPLMFALKKKYDACLLVTFFSPSGYHAIKKKKNGPDFVYYLPWDTPKNAYRFLSIVQPCYIFFVKYDLWYYFLTTAKKKKIPLFLINGFFHKKQIFFRLYGGVFRYMLHQFTHIFVQNHSSKKQLESIHIPKITVVGDTKYDYVQHDAKKLLSIPVISLFKGKKKLVVVGSSWTEDIQLLMPLIQEKSYQWIIAPHVVEGEKIKVLEKMFSQKIIRYTQLQNTNHPLNNLAVYDILIMDQMGLLFALYAYADYAYVGGGMKQGLHNILEPAVFNIPIFFGNQKYQHFPEAHDLIAIGAAFAIKNTEQMKAHIGNIDICNIKKKMTVFFEKKRGATKKVVDMLTF